MEPEMTTMTATRNACRLCAPLGASLAFCGVEGAVPFLHGSQGCATYIRRYMISHYKEPVDIASSSFGEAAAVFGGKRNLFEGLENVIRQYGPHVIGIATTCLSETIGEDVPMMLREFRQSHAAWPLPHLVHVSTPSYAGSHFEGYARAVHALVAELAQGGPIEHRINLFPAIVSPADLRHLREIFRDHGLEANLVPDYSDPLDGPAWADWRPRPEGGTPLADVRRTGRAAATIELGMEGTARTPSAGAYLAEKFAVPLTTLGLPIGLRQTDALFSALQDLTGAPSPESHTAERGRLIDSYVDAHKYIFGKRAVVYGEEALVVGLASFLAEIGIEPAVCATSSRSGRLKERLAAAGEMAAKAECLEDVDFARIEEASERVKPDLLIGSSKGYAIARKLGVPLIRVGFPIHDRIGGARVLHVGYRGAQQLFDRIVNTLIETRQDRSPVGYSYM